MKQFRRTFVAFKKLFFSFFIQYTPFISSITYCIHTYKLSEGIEECDFYFYNSEMTGHSIFWLIPIYAYSVRMCVWYRRTILLLMLTHPVPIFYKNGYLTETMFLDILFSLCFASILTWCIYRFYKTITNLYDSFRRRLLG